VIRQQIGDLLEFEYEGRFYYIVVLTKIVMFGGNIVFAHHTDGTRCLFADVNLKRKGFNICTDLLFPKREGKVRRIHRYEDISEFWMTKYAKGTNEYRRGHRAKEWYVYHINDLRNHIGRFRRLPRKYRSAMDHATFSFDRTAQLILDKYTPDKNEHL